MLKIAKQVKSSGLKQMEKRRVVIPHFTISIHIRNGCLPVYCEVIPAEFLIQLKHCGVETEVEDAVKQAFDAVGIAALSSQDVFYFRHILLLSLMRQLIACLCEFGYRPDKIILCSLVLLFTSALPW
jgi:hypothetical protein